MIPANYSFRQLLERTYDTRVSPATTKVSVQRNTDIVAGRVGVRLKKRVGRERNA